MRLIKCTASNFSSYKNLEFNFLNQGLTLIHGATGAGKSTLQDVAVWALFGVTAKNGTVDDVRNWTTKEPTQVELELLTNSGDSLTVVRKRGTSSQNDLYWTSGNEKIRGKDINETQKLLEQKLGISADLYLTGAYFHEFSASGSFFVAKAKNRRAVFEQIADLEFPIVLTENLSNELKVIKNEIQNYKNKIQSYIQTKEFCLDNLNRLKVKQVKWDADIKLRITTLTHNIENFESNVEIKKLKLKQKQQIWELERKQSLEKAFNQLEKLTNRQFSELVINEQINVLSKQASDINATRCDKCGSPTKSQEKEKIMSKIHNLQLEKQKEINIQTQISALKKDITRLNSESNPFTRELNQTYVNTYKEELETVLSAKNPFTGEVELAKKTYFNNNVALGAAEDSLKEKQLYKSELDLLLSLMDKLRVELVTNTIKNIELDTNRRLNKFFDSEIKVNFELQGLDKVEVLIHKNGYECSFKQLSKGQRGLLKLCFVTSVMKASANNAGTHFDTIMLDEALDGLDDNLKQKAFSLLEELSTEHETVLVIDHSPNLKQMFQNSYLVEIIEDKSVIHDE